MENHLDKTLDVRRRFHRWATGGPPEACYLGGCCCSGISASDVNGLSVAIDDVNRRQTHF